MDSVIQLLVYFLGAVRFSSMLADTGESGPGLLLDKIRSKAGITYDAHNNPVAEPGSIGDGLLCPYCSSLWFGILIAVLHIISPKLAFLVALPLAISEVVVLKVEGFPRARE